MLKSYFKVAFRNLLRNKAFAAINILGLAIGMSSALLILLWVQNEFNLDASYKKSDRIYTMYNRGEFDGVMHAWNSTPKIMATTLKNDYPEVEEVARVNGTGFLLTTGDRHFNVRGAFTDSGFFKIFDLPLLKGDPVKALTGSNSIVVTEKLAKKLFGDEDAM